MFFLLDVTIASLARFRESISHSVGSFCILVNTSTTTNLMWLRSNTIDLQDIDQDEYSTSILFIEMGDIYTLLQTAPLAFLPAK